jgi:hypothetical protein
MSHTSRGEQWLLLLSKHSSLLIRRNDEKRFYNTDARSNDDRVQDLKEEVKSLRTDQHIRHLTKELSAAKLALERERKLRALQMDAIKVHISSYPHLLWAIVEES